jgi:hypothetical protein
VGACGRGEAGGRGTAAERSRQAAAAAARTCVLMVLSCSDSEAPLLAGATDFELPMTGSTL